MRLRLVLSAWLVCGSAFAGPVTLRYERPADLSCPQEAELRGLIAARLGSDPFVADADALVIVRIHPHPTEDALQAEVLLEKPVGTAHGKKTLTSPGKRCADLAASVAVTVALTVDSFVRRPDSAAPPAPLPPPPPVETAPPPAAPPATRPPPRHPPSVDSSLALGASMALGLSVGPQPTLHLEGRARLERLSVGLEGRFGWPVVGELPEGALATSALLGAVVPCLHAGGFSGCLELAAGALRLEGLALAGAQQASVFQALVGVRGQYALPVARGLSVALVAEGLVPLTRATALVGTTRVWTVPPVGGALGAWAIFLL